MTEQPEDPSRRPSLDADRDAADQAAAPLDFDPYRFGRPEQPVPPEFAPPGYHAGPPLGGSPPAYGPPGPTPRPPAVGQPWGAPYGSPPPRRSSAKATASLVLGIASIVLSLFTFLDAVVVVAALVLGGLALVDTRSGDVSGRGRAIAGIVCALVGVALAVALTIFATHLVASCGTHESGALRQCLRQRYG